MSQKTTAPANDDEAPTLVISFTELCEKSGMDEDTLLERLAGILSKREGDDA